MSSSATVRAGDSREPRTWGPLGAALVAGALFYAGLALPPFGFLLAVFAAAPVAVQRLRGTGPALVTILVAAALIASFTQHTGLALFFVGLYALPGFLIGEGLARGHGLRQGSLWAFLLLSAEIGLALFFNAPGMSESLTSAAALVRSPEFLAGMRGWGLPTEQIDLWTEQAKTWEGMLAVVYPAVWIVMGGALVGFNAVAVRTYLARRDPAWLDGSEFEGIRMPFALAPVFIVAGASVLVPPLRNASYNVLVILAFLTWLQGLGVVLYYANRLAGPPFLRRMVVVLVLVNPWSRELLALLGLFDLWLDFRKYADLPDGAK